MQTLWQDLRYGVRMLIKSPGFTLIAVLLLALGIGANTAIFTVVNAVMLRPLPYPNAERLMQLGRAFTGSEEVSAWSTPKFNFVRANSQSFEAIASTQEMGPNVFLADGNPAEYLSGCWVSADFLRVLGVTPASGRDFTAEEDSPSGARVAMVSDALWRRRFGADASVIGHEIMLNGAAHTVVGVLPPGFVYPGMPDIYVPLGIDPASQNEGHNSTVIARLKPDVTPAQAGAELKLLFDRFRMAYPNQVDGKGHETFGARNWRENLTGETAGLLWLLLGAACCVLLIACANVANLQLARAAVRRKEIAIRMALGAGAGRLLRQMLTEGVLLAGLGGGAGLLLAVWLLEALLVSVPAGMLPRANEVTLDGRVLAFASGVSLLTGVLTSLAPALQARRTDVDRQLKEGAGQNATGAARGGLRNVLVVTEIALALMLTIGAALLLRTFANLRGVEPGFETRQALSFELSARGKNYDTVARMNEFYDRALERFRALPGVEAAALTNKAPLDGWFNLPYRLVGEQNKFSGSAEYRLISPDYFQVMKMSLQSGRHFNESDTAGAESVIIINEAFARKHFKDADPLGQTIFVCCTQGDLAPRHIIGVVNETKQRSLSQPAPLTVFIPLRQADDAMKAQAQQTTFVLRTTGDPLALAELIRHEARQLDPALPLRNLRSLEQLLSRSVAPQRFNLFLLTLFAALGLALALTGIYGALAYGVSQRTHELGLRMALGAQTRDVLTLVIKQGMVLAGLGVAGGLLAAWALTRLLKTLLFSVSTTDPLTFSGVSLGFLLVALLACYIPARRAARVDPMVALRYE